MSRAWATSPSLRMIFRLSRAATTGSGLAEWVDVIEPGGYSPMIALRPITADSGSEELMPLPQTIRSGLTPYCS